MKITITTYKNNTVYSVEVSDKYGKNHHLGYINYDDISNLSMINSSNTIGDQADNIWKNAKPPCPERELLSKAIKSMIDIDIKNGRTPTLD
tara:strand:+ start:190 stop:462 length:273 start_codon:yes stop_codon:yes gene_type:complete